MSVVDSYAEVAAKVLCYGNLAPGAWEAVWVGAALGLGAAMPVGPVNVEIARRVLRDGMAAGVALGMGAVTVDVTYAVLSTLSFVKLLNRPIVIVPVATSGAVLLAYLGVQCLRAARRAWTTDPILHAEGGEVSADPSGRFSDGPRPDRGRGLAWRAYLVGLLMTFANPLTLVFWFSAVPTMAAGATTAGAAGNGADRIAKAAADNLPMMCAGVFIGTVAWVLAFSSLLAWAARRAGGGRRASSRRKWMAAADAVGGATLLGFAVAAGWQLAASGAFLRLLGSFL